ncbi:3' exoribonuclease family protein [Verticillium dahliae VdLs.17]|uniref:3' exoribonuclease family protein n=1 Tax=Verticillium dahliae (strain VdLs.17 / ATCC MYA-4575 / FGSC 10137) TaxID=498257 RepID=G2XJU5_VERDV|nr:3' exoribonuclease family protein [Verticillium dahliae VdLs.17]EGY20798.1 3' exoribonuclease family protein [Verticillium dahliae VdLs.17]
MTDRRRINGPSGATHAPVYEDELGASRNSSRLRPANTMRNLFLKTGIAPAASGSAYAEIEAPAGVSDTHAGMKLICTVHGPRALPRSAPFSPYLVLSTHVKYAPFATRQRRGYLRDASERDLSVHLETALRGVVIGERWPKSGLDVTVTILEGDQERGLSQAQGHEDWDMMNVLGGCITVAAAAIADAGIDCVDMVTGGVAALIQSSGTQTPQIVLDPVCSEHDNLLAACCVAYMPSRDEVTNLWIKGQLPPSDAATQTQLVRRAIQASKGNYKVLVDELGSFSQNHVEAA